MNHQLKTDLLHLAVIFLFMLFASGVCIVPAAVIIIRGGM